jgi:hypothetical protein
VPDAPINLNNDATTTDDIVIRFTWSQGASNGGASVIDYSIFYDQAVDDFIYLDTVTTRSYLTTVTLIPGETYKFKVTARNTVGSSQESAVLSVIAAKVPDAPVNLSNVPEVTNAY